MKSNKKLIIARYLLGSILMMFGFNEFHNFLPGVFQHSQEVVNFVDAMKRTHFLYYLVKGIELLSATLLVGGVFIPLANMLIFPIIVVIFLTQLFLDPQIAPLGFIMIILSLYISYQYKNMYKFLFKYNSELGTDIKN